MAAQGFDPVDFDWVEDDPSFITRLAGAIPGIGVGVCHMFGTSCPTRLYHRRSDINNIDMKSVHIVVFINL